MERLTESRSNLLINLIDNYQVVRSRPQFKIYPQMPHKQIQHFVKQASMLNKKIAIQLNSSPFTKELNEVIGVLKVSKNTSHVILTTETNNTIHLIQPEYIRHIRLI